MTSDAPPPSDVSTPVWMSFAWNCTVVTMKSCAVSFTTMLVNRTILRQLVGAAVSSVMHRQLVPQIRSGAELGVWIRSLVIDEVPSCGCGLGSTPAMGSQGTQQV